MEGASPAGENRRVLPAIPSPAAFEALRLQREPWIAGLTWIAERHGLGGERLELVTRGSNVVFASASWVVKLYAPPFLREFHAERLLLEAAERRLGLATPPLEAVGHLVGWGYAVQGRLPGVSAREAWPEIPRAQQARLLAELGAALARLHALALPALERLGPTWPDLLAQQQGTWRAGQRAQGASEAWIAQAAALLARTLPALLAGSTVPVHADVTHDHLLVERHGDEWRATGLIDFADATSAPAAYDLLGPLTHWVPDDPALQQALLDGYGLPRAERSQALAERLLALALLHRFVRLPHVARRLVDDTPEALAAVLRGLYPALTG